MNNCIVLEYKADKQRNEEHDYVYDHGTGNEEDGFDYG